ncbi:MAG: hypothetical protein KAJ10_03650 [Thermodesulfovibrionia bacterium]|nr:hypothetical protein [Thermodesulfovibrionia bacterium]
MTIKKLRKYRNINQIWDPKKEGVGGLFPAGGLYDGGNQAPSAPKKLGVPVATNIPVALTTINPVPKKPNVPVVSLVTTLDAHAEPYLPISNFFSSSKKLRTPVSFGPVDSNLLCRLPGDPPQSLPSAADSLPRVGGIFSTPPCGIPLPINHGISP